MKNQMNNENYHVGMLPENNPGDVINTDQGIQFAPVAVIPIRENSDFKENKNPKKTSYNRSLDKQQINAYNFPRLLGV